MARNVALTIGVNKYQYERSLAFAENDAVAMQRYLQSIGFEEVLLYSDHSSKRPPNLVTLLNGIQRIADTVRLDPEDSFWFFFSGHGGRQNEQDFLLPTEGHPDYLVRTAIAIDDVVQALRRCQAGNLVLILDACRNPVPKRGKNIGSQTAELVRRAGIITLFSCSPGEKSYELEEVQHGAFTYALLEALRGDCVPSQCNAKQLSAYLQQTVPTLTQNFGRQRPYVIAEPVEKATQLLLPPPSDPEVISPSPVSAPSRPLKSNVAGLIRQAVRVMQQKQWRQAENLWDEILIEADDREDRQFAREQLKFVRQQTSLSSPIPAPPPASVVPKAQTPVPPTAPHSPPSLSSQPSLLTVSFETVRVNDKGKIVEQSPKQAQYFTEELGDDFTFDMIKIEGGSFDMGSNEYDREQPIHPVTVPSFYMGKFVVTQAVYARVTGQNPATNSNRDRFVDPNKPIINVSWNDAIAFCKALNKRSPLRGQNYRLPTEAEWEYACRAGTTTKYSFGNAIASEVSHYNQPWNSSGTVNVNSYLPNDFGLFNMHGNVWEWCEDHWHKDYNGAPDNGSAWVMGGDSDFRVIRGGSWNYNPGLCRSAYRSYRRRGYRNVYLGLRVVVSAPRT